MAETSVSGSGRPSLPMQGVSQPSRDEVLNLPRVHISSHPVMKHKMTALRDKNTQPPEFYQLVKEIGALLAYEATANLALEPWPIETPMEPMTGERLAGGIGVTPILRAGLGLAEGFRQVISDMQVWHLGLRRDEHTLEAMEYYNQLPHKVDLQVCTLLIPCWRRAARPLMPSTYSNAAAFHACATWVLSRPPMVCSSSRRRTPISTFISRRWMKA